MTLLSHRVWTPTTSQTSIPDCAVCHRGRKKNRPENPVTGLYSSHQTWQWNIYEYLISMGGFNGTLHLEMEDFDKGTTPSLPVPSKSLEESFTIPSPKNISDGDGG